MMASTISTTPLWLQNAAMPATTASPLPDRVDVLVIGAGYTGLAAAREMAAAGRSTLVVDAGDLGAGCSSRNGGQIAYSIKPSFDSLKAKFGADLAFRICREGLDAVTHLRSFAAERADCEWREAGCFFGAHTAKHFGRMVRDAENQPRGLEQRISIVRREQQRDEIASDFYHGGCVYPDDASVDPARLLLALLGRALESGVTVRDRTSVTAIKSTRDGFEALTPRGVVRARQVLLATNGHSGPLSPWHRRRVIPIGSYQIATEPLGADRVRTLIPRGRNIVDSRRVVVYFRPSADGERIVFGGRAALAEKDPRVCVPRLQQMMQRIFPQLEGVRVSHAWVGWVAYTFDTLPHLGRHQGIYYCMGYCGQGVPLAPYFGKRIGQQMVGLAEGRTALDGLPFPSRPYYHGKPWFLAPSVLAYRLIDAAGL
ncbi:MAG TPA: FAD-binding oxidoreductase [Steroidobacteraceae bacterium]|jgi:glycine/D-amino acid oxidase-like deaminating enzyme|nr:FAD-binding oxidoreductase [Steroidobacteraceae bacterium]